MAVAWIGFAGGVLAALFSAAVAVRQSQMDERLARLRAKLEDEVHQRQAQFDRQLLAEDVLTRYREPLAAAAFDLQSRLYNLLRLNFFDKYGGTNERAEVARKTTLFRLAQYFGWTEILRRDIQYLSFPEDEDTRRVAALQSQIAKCFLTDAHGPALMIWADEQRAIGEAMIVYEQDKVFCMGYAAFDKECEGDFALWYSRLGGGFEVAPADARLREAQHLLCELVEALDKKRVRYAEDLGRA